MENKLMRGKPVADRLTEDVVKQVEKLNKNGFYPKLAMLRVGKNEADLSYQKGAVARCGKCNILTEIIELDENCTQQEYIDALEKLNRDDSVNGILCFRPLPSHIDEDTVKYHIDEKKDVDCFSPDSLVKIISGDKTGFPPCTPMGVIEILQFYGVELIGKNVTVLGRSMVVGKPLSMLLLNRDSTVTICHSKSKDLKEITSSADILVSCMGIAGAVTDEYVKKDAVIVDVGINFDEDGKMCGDVDFDSVIDKVRLITPVPGGVGSVTTSVLARHVLRACLQQNGL